MRVSPVYPQNCAVAPVEKVSNPVIVQQHQNTTCKPSKRCIRLSIFISVVVLIVICIIVIPLLITGKCHKNTYQITTKSITDETSMKTKITELTMITTHRTEITGKFTLSDRTTIIESQETMALEVSSDSDTHSMVSVDTSTNINSITNDWTMNMMETSVSNMSATENTMTTVSIESKSTTTTTTTQPSMIRLNRMNDTITGLGNTVAGGPNGGFHSGGLPSGGRAEHAMDGELNTKYYNTMSQSGAERAGIDSGFIVIPLISNSTVACALRFVTANDVPGRDPITVTLEGSNATNMSVLNFGSSWTLIYKGPTGIGDRITSNTSENGTQQDFNNTMRFASYRLLVTSKRNSSSNAVQYAEAEIIGYI